MTQEPSQRQADGNRSKLRQVLRAPLHVQFIPCIVPRICMGWRTIQMPTAKRSTLSSAQGANAFKARASATTAPERSDSRLEATAAIRSPGRASRVAAASPPPGRSKHSPLRLSQERPAEVRDETLRRREHRVIARQEVKTVMRQPHAETKGNQRIRKSRRHLEPAAS